jgi:Transglutaminase-like superfamily
MLGLMRLTIRLPFRTVSRAVGLQRGETPTAVAPETSARAAAVGWAVRAAASYTPWENTCLVQALAATTLLRRRGIDSTLYLGVARDRVTPDAITAHAWLRCGELTVTGAAEQARYTPVASFATGRG